MDEVNRQRILSLTNGKDYGMCPPPMEAQVAIHELCRYFLGNDWYTTWPMGAEQVNTEIVFAIESLYGGCERTTKRKWKWPWEK